MARVFVRAILVVTLVLALLAAGAGFAFADGGPPPLRPEPGTRIYAPVLEHWTLLAAGGGTEVGGSLCDDAQPCDQDALVAAARAGSACAVDARLWLASAPRETLALRDVTILASVVVWSGAGEVSDDGVWNSSVSAVEFDVPWENGWWWRQESERLDVAFPAPCDARLAKIAINVRGRDMGGDERRAAQTATLAFLPES